MKTLEMNTGEDAARGRQGRAKMHRLFVVVAERHQYFGGQNVFLHLYIGLFQRY